VVVALVGLVTPSPTVAQTGPRELLASEAQQVLRTACSECHGETIQRGDVGSVLSIDGLVRGGIVLRGDPDHSPLIQRLAPEGDMPLRRPPLGAAERETLIRWIREGAPEFASNSRAREAVDEFAVSEAIAADLASLPETDQPFTRYFTLHDAHNRSLLEPDWPQRRQQLEDAILVLLNSLSWRRDLVRMRALSHALVLRFDLRSIGWTPEKWNLLVRSYPYAARLRGQEVSSIDERMRLAPGLAVPCLRGDWFVANASRSPLYEGLLDLPRTRSELERRLGVDVAANLRDFSARRAGFTRSGVARHNRVIERHESPFGAYWQSYDFADDQGPHNIFENPLGPGAEDGAFVPSGGEIIFNLPNGLQGYLLVDAGGARIADAPTGIVHDGTNPDDPVVHNAVSCMGCHGLDGIKPHADEVSAVQLHRGASDERRRAVASLYGLTSERMEADRARYTTALSQLLPTSGPTHVSVLPVASVARDFARPLDADAVASSLGLTVSELRAMVPASATLRAAVGPVLAGTPVAREVFDCAWRTLVREVDPSRSLVAEGGPTPAACPGTAAVPHSLAARVCDSQWEVVRAYTAQSTSAQWDQARACDSARAQLATQVQGACAGDGLTVGSADAVPCECVARRDTRSGRTFASCTARGRVDCGRYQQRCR
jgi:mono/diheme cytochrome c family protein